MKIELDDDEFAAPMMACHACGAILTEGRCLSCGHQQCFLCPPYVEKPSYDRLEAEVQALRRELWLRHGHTGMYGDDGEMQCGQCAPFGMWDWKRESTRKILECLELQRLKEISNARRGT